MSKKDLRNPIDQKDRDKIVRDLDKTILVEAGAGSGKTESLVSRMLALLEENKCTVNTLAAVTFTNKAAAELRHRFQIRLEEEARGSGPPAKRVRLNSALQNLEQCFIGTIHSFCAKLLRERPVEAGLDPDFKEMENIEEAVFRNRSWFAFLIRARESQTNEIKKLKNVGIIPEDLLDAFTALCLFPEVNPAAGIDNPPDFILLKSKLIKFLEGAAVVLPFDVPEKGFDGVQKLLRRALFRFSNLGFEEPSVLMDTYLSLAGNQKVVLNRWPTKELAKTVQTDLDLFREQTVKPAVNQWHEYRHSLVLSFLKPAVAYYSVQRKEHARLNFQDLLQAAAAMLRDNPKLRRYFRKRCTHILVDEFQDTDPIQVELLFYLTGIDFDEKKDWRKLTPAPGSLFLVGDPKQSIYRFRRADISTYNLVKKRIKECGGEILSLTQNFRSLPCLCHWCDQVFERIFPEEASDYQAQFVSLAPFRKDEQGLSGIYQLKLPKVKFNNEKNIAAGEADAIASWIKYTCDSRKPVISESDKLRPTQPGDFLILFRYRKNMEIYARALEEQGLPFEISGGKGFASAAEIHEILLLAKALAAPDNPVFTLAALRGIFFGISDAALVEFKLAGGQFSYLADNSLLARNGLNRILSALITMQVWRDRINEHPPSFVLEKILADTGLIFYLISSDMGSSRAGNLFKLLEMLRAWEREETVSWKGVVELLDEVVSVYDMEESSLFPDRTDAVRLMNLHKAKGLEAPVVILAHPIGQKPIPPDHHIARSEESGSQGYFIFKKERGFQKEIISLPRDWGKIQTEEKLFQAAEEERLMYVAATRAKNLLVISTYADDLFNKSAWFALDSFIRSNTSTEIPELKWPAREKKDKEEEIEITGAEVQKATDERAARISVISRPGYHLETVTSLAKTGADTPPWQESGRGMGWGRIVHSVLDTLGRQPEAELEVLLQNALTIEERDPLEKSILLNLIRRITASEFWMRAQMAEVKYFEVPFCLTVETEKPDPECYTAPMILSGTIDLVFKEKNSWVIADYKTDEVGDNLDDFVSYYSPQVRHYTRFWEKITGEKVAETGLFFTALNRWIRIDT